MPAVRRDLPPLNALRAFEAAARLHSFTRAAEELFVTQAAVSHQIKALEAHLAVRLFERLPRQLVLTDEGRAYARALTRSFTSLATATDKLRARLAKQAAVPARTRLTVSVIPSFAARWLVPRLGRFRALHPGIDVGIQPDNAPADFARGQADVGIRFGLGRYPRLRTLRLMDDESFPVCHPKLLRGRRALRTPRDLRHHVLLHDDDPVDWTAWLRAAGVSTIDAHHGPVFTDASMVIEAALEGQGVALTRRVLASGELQRGRLVQPFALALPSPRSYFFVTLPARASEPAILAFRRWLQAECGDSA
jgi:LysR family glycine cleavage system transcriptional activator